MSHDHRATPALADRDLVAAWAHAPGPVREYYRQVNAIQVAAMRALALASRDPDPDVVRRVSDEAKRRAVLMGDVGGWESVADDLAAARWRP